MRIFFTVAICFAVFFTACEQPGDGNGGSTGSATLQVNNQSGRVLDNVAFQNIFFARENADIIGNWTGRIVGYAPNYTAMVDISDTAFVAFFESPYDGRISAQGSWTRNGNTITFHPAGGLVGFGATATISGGTLTVSIDDGWDGLTYTLTSDIQAGMMSQMSPGSSVTREVSAVSAFIIFEVNSVRYFTSLVTVEENSNTVFTFINSTVVTNADTGEQMTLGSL